MRKILFLTMFLIALCVKGGESPGLVFASLAQMKKDQWQLSGNVSVIVDGNNSCLRLENHSDKRQELFIYLPLDFLDRYVVRAVIKTQDVKSQGRQLGATVFISWADKDKKWLPGGSFPRGVTETADWQELRIECTNAPPHNMRFARLSIVLDGKGIMYLKNIQIEPYRKYESIKILSPKNQVTVDDAMPIIRWESISNPVRLIIAQDLRLNREVKVYYPPSNVNEFRIPEPLPSGSQWFWQLQGLARAEEGRGIGRSELQSFTIDDKAKVWPPVIGDEYRWSDKTRPELTITSPAEIGSFAVTVKIDEKDAEIIRRTPHSLTFVPKQDLLPGLHRIEFRFEDTGRVHSFENVYANLLPSHRVTFRNGITEIDGNPFFPIGAYRDPDDELMTFSSLKEAGFNLTHTYYFEQKKDGRKFANSPQSYLGQAEQNGLKVFLGYPRHWVETGEIDKIREFVFSCMDNPGLLAWYCYDEPIGRISVEKFNEAVRLTARTDPFHPTFVVSNHMDEISHDAENFSKHIDIWGVDPYPVRSASANISEVELWVANARKLKGPDNPVWAVIQVHDLSFWNSDKPARRVDADTRITLPTPEQIRCMTFLALAAGADGIIYYWLPKNAYHLKIHAKPAWDGVKQTIRDLHSISPFMTVARQKEPTLKLGHPDMRSMIRSDASGNKLFVLLNISPQIIKLDNAVEITGYELTDFDTQIRIGDQSKLLEFRPYEVKLFRLHKR